MIDDHEKSLNYTGIYQCPDDINNFRLRIQCRLDAARIDWQQQHFQWQQKCFSKWEYEFYRNEQNCLTDLDKKYHLDVEDLPEKTHEFDLYCYTNDDDYHVNDNYDNYLIRQLGNVQIVDRDWHEFDLYRSVLESMKNPVSYRDFEVMYIMADLGEYIETTWIKNEIVLCTIKYDRKSKILLVFPDFTTDNYHKIDLNSKKFCYKIENESSEISDDQLHKEAELYRKVIETNSNCRQQLVGDDFKLPPKNRLEIHLFFEVLWAKHFEHNPIFLQYFIDLPKHWSCDGPVAGISPICHTNNANLVHFGYGFDVCLSYNIEALQLAGFPQSPYIYFEIASKDGWHRYRTEGLTYKNLPISKSGQYNYELQCFRFVPDTVIGELRRFFIGDYRNYDDLTWIGVPSQDRNDAMLNKYGTNTLGTGQLAVRINVLHQSQAFLQEFAENPGTSRQIYEKLKCSSLVRSVEQVLKAFRRARRNMIEAKKNL